MKTDLLRKKTFVVGIVALVCLVVGAGFTVNAMTFSTSGNKARYYISLYKDDPSKLEATVQQHIDAIAAKVGVRDEFNPAIRDANAKILQL